MSLATKAVRGAIWNIGTGVGARLIGVIGTIILTRFLAPEVIGEVAVATALVLTANQLSNVGFGQYVIAKHANREEAFHATVFSLGLAAVVFIILMIWRHPLAHFFDASVAASYVPAMLIGTVFTRIGFTVSRVMIRDLRFRVVAIGRGISELVFSFMAVGLAILGWGGEAIVAAFVARGAILAAIYVIVTDRREWLQPCKLSMERTMDIFRFGIPLWVASVAQFSARQWDNLLVSRFFGAQSLGLYNYSYNLADIPAAQVGEHIGDVLLPSFARLDAKKRGESLVRATTLMALMVFPLAVGLGLISETLVRVLFNDEWQGIAPLLMILSALSVVRPVGWTINSYLTALHMVKSVMFLEVLKLVALLTAIVVTARFGITVVCFGVGGAYLLNAIASIWLVGRADRIPSGALLLGMVGPLLACGPMAGAVFGVRYGVGMLELPGVVSLAGETLAGAIAYVPSAFLFAPSASRDFLSLVKKALSRGDAAADD